MAAIFNEVELDWKGQTYTVTPTYRTIHKIEREYSLGEIVGRIAKGAPPLSHVAAVVSILLTEAGAKDAPPEDVFEVIMSEMSPKQFEKFCFLIVACVTPQRSAGGNVPPPKRGAKRKK